jgi:P4 family phage/plasmid primase-like protien
MQNIEPEVKEPEVKNPEVKNSEVKNPEVDEPGIKNTKLDFEKFKNMLNNQKEIADEFKLCYDKYIFEMEKKGGNLYKFNEVTKLWELTNENEYIGDYNKWLSQQQRLFINSDKLHQDEIEMLVKTITKKLDYSFAKKVFNYANIKVANLSEKFDKLYPLLIPTNDGKCYDLEKSILINRTKEHYMTYHYNVKYTKNKSEKIEDVINQLCCGDETVVKYLQRLLAYCISGNNSGQVFFVFNGKGSNGKSLLLNLVKSCMNKAYGAVNRSVMIKEKSSNINNAFYALSKRRLGVFTETEDGEKLNEDSIKKISGGDLVDCKKLFQDLGEHDLTLACKLILCTNNLPQFNGNSFALTRRLRLFKFMASFVEKEKVNQANHEYEKNVTLESTLVKGHLDEFFSWCVDGYKEFLEDPTFEKKIPKTIQQAQDEYIKNQQSFVCFMEQKIVCTKSEKDRIERADFYFNYTEFCKDNNINIVLKKKEIFEMADKIFGKPIKDNTLKYQFCKYTDE